MPRHGAETPRPSRAPRVAGTPAPGQCVAPLGARRRDAIPFPGSQTKILSRHAAAGPMPASSSPLHGNPPTHAAICARGGGHHVRRCIWRRPGPGSRCRGRQVPPGGEVEGARCADAGDVVSKASISLHQPLHAVARASLPPRPLVRLWDVTPARTCTPGASPQAAGLHTPRLSAPLPARTVAQRPVRWSAPRRPDSRRSRPDPLQQLLLS